MAKRHSPLSHKSDDDLFHDYDRLLLDLGWVQERVAETKADPKYRAAYQHYLEQERILQPQIDGILDELDARGLRN